MRNKPNVGDNFNDLRSRYTVVGFTYQRGYGIYTLVSFWGTTYYVWVDKDTVVKVVKE